MKSGGEIYKVDICKCYESYTTIIDIIDIIDNYIYKKNQLLNTTFYNEMEFLLYSLKHTININELFSTFYSLNHINREKYKFKSDSLNLKQMFNCLKIHITNSCLYYSENFYKIQFIFKKMEILLHETNDNNSNNFQELSISNQ